MRLGLVTYNIACDWDLPVLLEVCRTVGLDGVELRTTHAHGVEVSLSPEERDRVRRQFDDSGVLLVGLGSTFEYHSPDPDELRRNIEGTKEYVRLAADVGAGGVKVRPNALPEGRPVEATLEQIGRSLREVAGFAEEFGVQIRLEVHGRGTAHVPYIRRIVDVAGHPNLYVCWNSNKSDMDDLGSIRSNFELVRDRIGLVHINELWNDYPWREEFRLLREIGYDGFTLAEIPGMPDLDSAVRLLRYYKALWRELTA